jgi:hypothetical protein
VTISTRLTPRRYSLLFILSEPTPIIILKLIRQYAR